MKKILFVVVMVVVFGIIATTIKEPELQYNFPQDYGVVKLFGAMACVISALAASMTTRKKAVLIWTASALISAYFFGMLVMLLYFIAALVARLMVEDSKEIQDMLKAPFEPDAEA